MATKKHPDPSQHIEPPEIAPSMAAAKAIYESTPDITAEKIAVMMGVPSWRIREWKRMDQRKGIEWKRYAYRSIPQLTEKSQALADQFTRRMSERGTPMSDEVARRETAQELAEQHAVNQRASIIDRHRNEWAAPRKLAYEAIQTGNFDRAKLAKISAETLTLIQGGECRAWGIDAPTRGQGGGTVVVLDRGGNNTVEAEAGAAAESVEMPADVLAAKPTAEVTGDTSTSDDEHF